MERIIMKVVICDDEKRIREMIAKCVREVSDASEIELLSDAKSVVLSSFDGDILFLDIQMPGIDGMNAARLLRANGKKTVIIFVTALEECVFGAFDVGAFHYIVKPFDKNKIKSVFTRALEQVNESRYVEKMLSEKEDDEALKRAITVKSGGTNTKVIISEIVYAEVLDRRITLHMSTRDAIEYYGKMTDLESLLGKDFFRVHRAYLINLFYVKSYDSKNVNLAGENIPVARGKYQELIKAYLSFHTRKENL